MNRRQWKKRCKKAARELERRWPGEFVIVAAEGDETVSSPRRYQPERHEGRIGRRYTEAPRGTPGAWMQVNYEYDEWDFYTADQLLDLMVYAHDTDWGAIARAEGM